MPCPTSIISLPIHEDQILTASIVKCYQDKWHHQPRSPLQCLLSCALSKRKRLIIVNCSNKRSEFRNWKRRAEREILMMMRGIGSLCWRRRHVPNFLFISLLSIPVLYFLPLSFFVDFIFSIDLRETIRFVHSVVLSRKRMLFFPA